MNRLESGVDTRLSDSIPAKGGQLVRLSQLDSPDPGGKVELADQQPLTSIVTAKQVEGTNLVSGGEPTRTVKDAIGNDPRSWKARLIENAGLALGTLALTAGCACGSNGTCYVGDTPSATSSTHPTGSSGRTIDMKVTFYGWYDNDPPGADIAYPTRHKQAGGSGTYNDPISFASVSSEFAPGTIVYIPYLQKYAEMEDLCGQCSTDWQEGEYHIDVWTNYSESNGLPSKDALIAREDSLTRDSTEVIVDPSPNLPVNSTPLFPG
jgi:hypothetical protein